MRVSTLLPSGLTSQTLRAGQCRGQLSGLRLLRCPELAAHQSVLRYLQRGLQCYYKLHCVPDFGLGRMPACVPQCCQQGPVCTAVQLAQAVVSTAPEAA